jgi:membrane protease YdiL (CAAX protease family)
MSKISLHLKNITVKYPLLCFYGLTFLFSWCIWFPAIVAHYKTQVTIQNPKVLPFILLGSFGPFFASIIVSGISGGKSQILRLFKKLIIWRVHVVWYGIAIFSCTLINFFLSLCILPFLPDISFRVYIADVLKAFGVTPLALLIKLPTGPLGEELGWRGFALPTLQMKLNNALKASILQGIVWAVWHTPILVFSEWRSHLPALIYFLVYVSMLTSYSILMTWVFNNTKGSVLHAMLLHAAFNGTMGLLLSMLQVHETFGMLPMLIVVNCGNWVVALVLILFFGSKYLSRQKDFTFEEML